MAKSKVPPRTSSAPPPKLAAAAAAAAAAQQQQQQAAKQQQQQQQHHQQLLHASTPPRTASPSLPHDGESMQSSSKKKKKKSKAKAKDSDLSAQTYDLDDRLSARPPSPSAISATAQAQADLLATASDLYRRIEADPHGIPDDDAYWTSLPAHLRTFIRNALPLGQFPPSAQAALNGNPNDPNARHASTQAMIAVAQQLAQAAHASQRHLQQFPPGTHPYPPLPFDPSIFADLALHPDQPLPLHPHPNSGATVGSMVNGNHAAYAHGHVQYTTSSNPPPTQPPGEPLPAPVVLVNEYGEETGDYDDEYYSEDELDHDGTVLDHRGNVIQTANGIWMQEDAERMDGHRHHHHHHNGVLSATAGQESTPSKSKKKKKKKKGTSAQSIAAANEAAGGPHYDAPAQPQMPATRQARSPASTAINAGSKTAPSQPPPSSRAAGKQPMTFSSTGKAPARPANGAPPPTSNAAGKRPLAGSLRSNSHAHGKAASPPARIWSTSSVEERDRIKEFWLGLSEKDRRELVKLEKETVLKKMKDQQKHGCTCAVCGRKRSAIEDELEVLYDAYYDELEEYANHQQRWQSSGGTIPPPPGPGPFPGSVALDSSGAVIGGEQLSRARSHANRDSRHGHGGHHHPQAHGHQKKPAAALHPESSDGYDDDELDDEEFDDEDDEEFDEEDEEDEAELEREREREDAAAAAAAGGMKKAPGGGVIRRRSNAAANGGQNDLFGLGSSLTVKGGILTVADDLLKNDGQKFLEMMEQLAERRMQREEEAGAELGDSEEEDDEDPVDDLDEDEEDLEDEEDEEDDIMTDEQRMEEGRRMFQIFAARMFEQRVLQAYREKVAQERQLQLLRELEEEDMNEKAKEAKRQKDNQKKKDKKRMQREQREAERLRKEQERAAEEAAAKARAEKQREADLKRQEELRAKREAERRAKEEEKARKEEEKRRRQAEERERELERERKKKEKEEKARLEREAKEREKKQKEEEAKRAKEEREKAEREQQERERKAKEEEAKKAAETARKEKEAAEKARQQQRAATAASQAPVDRTASASPSAKTPTRPPGVNVQHGAARSKNGTVQDSPSSQAGAKPSRTASVQRQTPAAASGSGLPSPAASTLPAPPQGLPPRPSNAVVNPTGHHQASQGPASVSVSANAGLPRPPVSASIPPSSVPPLGFGSIGPQSFGAAPGLQQPTPSKMASSTAAKAPQTPQQTQGQQPHFAHHHLPQHHPPISPGSATPGSRTAPTFAPANFDALRSPTLPNGLSSGLGLAGKGSVDSALQSPGLGMPSALSSATNNLASLSLGGTPVGSGMHGSKPVAMGLGAIPGAPQQSSGFVSHGLSGSVQGGMPIGQGAEPLRSRAPSMAESDQLSNFGGGLRSSSALSQRPIQRPTPPTPIGPIGRPRPSESHTHDDPFGMGGNGRSSSSASGSGSASPKLPEGILGSSALGGDDELVEPKPRRVSNTVPISGGTGGGAFFGMGSSAVGSSYGMSGPSPWNSFSGAVASATGPLSPAFSNAAVGSGSAGMTSALNLPQASSGGPSAIDPWARAQTSWDRARSAFEQPGGGGGLGAGFGQLGGLGSVGGQMLHSNGLNHHAQHHALSGPTGGAGVSPFGAPRSIFGNVALGGTSQHPGAIGSALSPTSPASRHVGGGDRGGL
ncbi:Stress response protein nst1 [Thecaphora frezii]